MIPDTGHDAPIPDRDQLPPWWLMDEAERLLVLTYQGPRADGGLALAVRALACASLAQARMTGRGRA